MKIIILIKANTSAFQREDGPSGETARILRALAKKIDGHPHFSEGHDQALYDANGLEVGFCTAGADDLKWEL